MSDKPTCFIIMPISTPTELVPHYSGDAEHFRHVLEHIFILAVERIGYLPIPPMATGADVIHAEIIRNLETADLILCDMTCLNPNVFFELGIRTAIDKPVALVKDHLTQRVPFDTALINHHTYDGSLTPWTLVNQIERLSEHLLETISNSKNRNPLWKYFGLTTRGDILANSSIEEKIDLIIRSLTRIQDLRHVSESFDSPKPSGRETEFVEKLNGNFSAAGWPLETTVIGAGKVVLDLRKHRISQSLKHAVINYAESSGVEVTFRE
ncbi:MAG: hypothetical protein HY327_04810 [Chloroflexi bacterium]|nr:hypothetical protein [Chloroflexota bacterium]